MNTAPSSTMPSSTMPSSTDVAVIGGGPAGAAVAATLRRAGVDVTVIDPAAGRLGVEDFRVGETAPPGTERTITDVFGPDDAGLAFDPSRHAPTYANRAAWGGDEPVTTDFMFNPHGHGWHLDRVAFDRGLLAAAARLGARVVNGWRVRSGDQRDRWWDLHVEPVAPVSSADTERILAARVVCDASGRRAGFARTQGAQMSTGDRLVAVVGVLEPSSPDPDPDPDPDGTTLVEAVEDGWWYTAAIPGSRRVVAMFTDGDLLDPTHDRSAAGFLERLEHARHVGAAVHDHGGVFTRRLLLRAAGTTWLDRPAGVGWLAAGDAAAALDPLSSQGILSALVMGQRAGRALAQRLAASSGDDPFDDYVSDYRRLVERYRAEQGAAYLMEGRWPLAPFWHRRRVVDPGSRSIQHL